MNAVVGALARGSAWRGPRGLAGGDLRVDDHMTCCPTCAIVLDHSRLTTNLLYLHSCAYCTANVADCIEFRSKLHDSCELSFQIPQAASWLAAAPSPAAAFWRPPAAAAGAAVCRLGTTPRCWRRPASWPATCRLGSTTRSVLQPAPRSYAFRPGSICCSARIVIRHPVLSTLQLTKSHAMPLVSLRQCCCHTAHGALLTPSVVMSQVREVFEDIVASGRAPSLAIWNTLLAGLAAQSAWLDALSALQQVQPG